MSTNQPRLISCDNLSHAWGKVFLKTLDLPQNNPAPMLITVTGFQDNLPKEDSRIREKLEQSLAAYKKNPCNVSAMVVFPFRQWQKRGYPSCEEFSKWCVERFIPRLKRRDKRNRKGLYFGRMMDFKGGLGKDEPGMNQLKRLIDWYNNQRVKLQARPPRSRMQVACFDPFSDHKHECRPYFPCLQQVGFSYDSADGLAMNAYYPTQYIFDRAYGNYLGLCHLGAFMAHELELNLVRLNCFIGRAELGGKKVTKESLASLKKVVKQVLQEESGDDNE